ncbi:hypothetical protein [Catellatospora chokoriensis]|uniref:Uncharacterized protein n=1 Tax=Catellatospora chokoriensis TaxID=310353 RepID=A0A8J3K0X5_9ACTN|nr:hypothetical protein [Catellatospora chokoriensis]GIF90442.1 hypothetical protein Cch02nite_38860 [Catellatospora chokoriensis]
MNSNEPRTRLTESARQKAADAVREALRRVDEQVDAMTDDYVESRLTALLAEAGVSRRSAFDAAELDLVRIVWEAELAAASTGVRGEDQHGTHARFELPDEAFEQLHGRVREDYDPPVKINVALDVVTSTITVSLVVAGSIADNVHRVTALVRTSEAGTITVPVAIDRTDAMLVGAAELDRSTGMILTPAIVAEVSRDGR